jgi:hypothetical protein
VCAQIIPRVTGGYFIGGVHLLGTSLEGGKNVPLEDLGLLCERRTVSCELEGGIALRQVIVRLLSFCLGGVGGIARWGW